jgi:hypothetical protein
MDERRRIARLKNLAAAVERLPPSSERERLLQAIRGRAVVVEAPDASDSRDAVWGNRDARTAARLAVTSIGDRGDEFDALLGRYPVTSRH